MSKPLFFHKSSFVLFLAMAWPLSSLACSSVVVPFDSIATPLEGKVMQAFGCSDAEGASIYVETRAPTPANSIKPGTTMVSFYKFNLNASNQWQIKWQARDFIPNSKHKQTLIPARFTVQDIDKDNLHEAYVFYTLPSSSKFIEDGKLLIYHKDRKFAIRGTIDLGPSDFSSRNLDSGFKSLPMTIQEHALSMWDDLATSPKNFSGEALYNHKGLKR